MRRCRNRERQQQNECGAGQDWRGSSTAGGVFTTVGLAGSGTASSAGRTESVTTVSLGGRMLFAPTASLGALRAGAPLVRSGARSG